MRFKNDIQFIMVDNECTETICLRNTIFTTNNPILMFCSTRLLHIQYSSVVKSKCHLASSLMLFNETTLAVLVNVRFFRTKQY